MTILKERQKLLKTSTKVMVLTMNICAVMIAKNTHFEKSDSLQPQISLVH